MTSKLGLLVEDDIELGKLIGIELAEIGFVLDHETDGERGLVRALTEPYELIILDMMLPSLDGVEICKRIREKRIDVPIIILTAKTDDLNKVLLLELGADDYITKPFNPLELRARIKAVLRRTGGSMRTPAAGEDISVQGLVINFAKRRVTLNEEEVELTPREMDLVLLLASRPGHPFSRAELNKEIYGSQVEGYERGVTSHINRIRQKIEPDPERPTFIRTIRGVGYCFIDVDG